MLNLKINNHLFKLLSILIFLLLILFLKTILKREPSELVIDYEKLINEIYQINPNLFNFNDQMIDIIKVEDLKFYIKGNNLITKDCDGYIIVRSVESQLKIEDPTGCLIEWNSYNSGGSLGDI